MKGVRLCLGFRVKGSGFRIPGPGEIKVVSGGGFRALGGRGGGWCLWASCL